MKYTKHFKKTLDDISEIIVSKYTSQTELGVLAGLSGLAMFQFYYSKYLEDGDSSNIGLEMLSFGIEKINSGYSNPTYSTGITGFGWTIQHLNNSNFIQLDCDELLSPFDEYLYNYMLAEFKIGNYDFLHGALGYAFYFLSRFESTGDVDLKKRYKAYLLESLAYLNDLSIKTNSGLAWESILDIHKKNKGYNLSLSHGISSILNYLARLYHTGIERKTTLALIQGGVSYITNLENKDIDNFALFPSWVEPGEKIDYNGRVAWCYGDLGIGLSLLRVGESISDDQLMDYSLRVLKQTTKRKLPKDTLVNDASICHGSYGNALIYNKLQRKKSDRTFQGSYKFWIEDGIQKATHKDGYCGYKQWYPSQQRWSPELSLLEGIAGIGLVIIDYLSENTTKWDECLMIS
ncbi:MAG: hypothetical protein CMH47_18255 [Muricauda sp.]|nr:hypothetical protein [Allomuricauda sp.]|tara:strand:- start:1708 stop:2922 length:1215 start_codon:yes stop_codon:yes gene_type:complete